MDQLYQAVTDARSKALIHGDYAGAIKEHENIVRATTKVLKSCSETDAQKIEQLRDQVKVELVLMEDILAELTQISRGAPPARAEDRSSGVAESDPDVWPPPTADPSRGSDVQRGPSGDNLPAWARAKPSQQQLARRPAPAPQEARRPAPVEDQRSAARLRNERDSVPANRKRFSLILTNC